jgi:hypothetical protein
VDVLHAGDELIG